MKDKKKVTILVTIALILATTAIALNVMSSDEIPTTKPLAQDQSGAGEIGIEIQASPIEDKLTESEPAQQ